MEKIEASPGVSIFIRCFLFAVMLAVHAARPATRSTHAFNEFFVGSFNSALPGFYKLGAYYPANPFVAGQRGDVLPGCERLGVTSQRVPEVVGKVVDDAALKFFLLRHHINPIARKLDCP